MTKVLTSTPSVRYFFCDKCGDIYEPRHPTGDCFYCCGMKMRRITECEHFVWIGAHCCDRCGKSAREHVGPEELKKGVPILGANADHERCHYGITWEEFEDCLHPERTVVVV